MSLVSYYPLDIGTTSGNNISNIITGTNVYDASLNGGAYISTSNFRLGNSALALDTSGQYVKINNPITTTNVGMTIAFWARANNSVGQYTLLDYSNGAGGNQKITLGLQNNTLYGQVINGTGIGTLTFTNSTTIITAPTSFVAFLCLTADGKRIIYTDNSVTIYTQIYNGSSWSTPVTLAVGTNPIGVCCTADGTRMVFSSETQNIKYATWNGTNYSGVTDTGFTTSTGSSISDGLVDMTPDGRILVVSTGVDVANYVWFSFWNTTTNNYTTFTKANNRIGRWLGSAITPDGTRIAYTDFVNNKAYYSVWNNTTQTYGTETEITTVNTMVRDVKFSKDGNIIFIENKNGTAATGFQYAIWNGTAFSSLTSFPSGVIPTTYDTYTIAVGWDNTLYMGSYGSSSILKVNYFVSNQYVATNFYSTQNLNDNSWRHYAWTIDILNTTYKYYLNGNLIKTDASSGYIFPAITTRTNALLGTSTDLSLSYFTGGIDNYRVYNNPLTDAQVAAIYKAEAYNGQTQIQYYNCDTPAFSNNNFGNYVSGSYIYDASLNAYAGANLVKNGEFNGGWNTIWTTSGLVGNTSFYHRENIPYNITTFGFIYTTAGSYATQNITFPKAGNYILTFYACQFQGVCTLTVSVNTLFTNTYSFGDYYWKQYTIPLYVSSPQTQALTFTLASGTQFVFLTGIVVQNTDNYISTTGYNGTQGSLSLDISGQTVKMNAPFSTTTSGLTYAFWARANNGCGQYTLLDYSNGPGGNHKITYGIQNNTIYAQVNSDASMNALTFTNYTTVITGAYYQISGFCMTADALRLMYCCYNTGNIYTYTYSGGSWNTPVSLALGSGIIPTSLCCTSDGSRLVVSRTDGLVQYATWNGSNYSGLTNTGFSGSPNGLDMTADGRILVVAVGHVSTVNSNMYFSIWNTANNNYTTFTAFASTKRWYGVSITSDGSRVAYTSGTDNVAYYSFWNSGSNTFTNETQLTTLNGTATEPRFSRDGNILFIGNNNATAATGFQYAVWNGTTYSSLISFPSGVFPVSYSSVGLVAGWDNSLYTANWSLTTGNVLKASYGISNQYTATNFYSAQNLNDNTWRHYAWTIDPSNTTYKYYINGNLIKTDISSAYVFPSPTTRTNNLLGTGADLPLSFFTGGIDNYQVYNGVYSDAQISALYKADVYGTQTPVTYYNGNSSSVSNNFMTNAITNTADSLLVGGTAITTTNYKTGITATGTGQYVQINNPLTTTTTSSGLTFSFWASSQNGSGINPLLDYSKGKGNNRISFSLWNGSPYTQVISDVSLGTITLTLDAGFSKTCTGNIFGITLSANHQRMAIITTTGVYYSTYSAGSWSSFTAIVTTAITGGGIAMSSDGTYLVWNQYSAYTYFSVWNATTGAYGTATQTLETNIRTFTSLHMTTDGSRIVACGGLEPAILYASWNGTNYSVFQTVPAIANTVSLGGSTNSSGTWGTPSAGSVFLNTVTQPETYYVWENYTSGVTAYQGDTTRPIIFEYNYNNTTGSSISATLYIIVDNYAYFYLNGAIQNGGAEFASGWPNGNSLSITLPTGNNRFQFSCRNSAPGAASLAVVVKSNTGTLLFNTNANNIGWTVTNPYSGMAITPDGSRIFYGIQVLTGNSTTTNSLYYADWNYTTNNYNTGTLIGIVNNNNSNFLRNIRCSPDGNIVFVSSYGTSFVSWYVFNGSSFVLQNSLSLSTNDVYAMDTVWDGSLNYLYIGYATSLTRYKYTASNLYSLTNFYTTQNLNDNVWRHFAWTIDPSTTTYKYYLNGVLIKTDISSGYVFPAQTTRTKNLLFTSTDLSMSYFVGSINNYRVYTGVLTDTQINTLFQTDAYGGQTPSLFQNYTFNQGAYSGSNLLNVATNIYDTSLNGGSYISTTNYQEGTGALSLDVSGQYAKMNTSLTTATNTGLSFSLLARANNGCGLNTLLDYSNGQGANNKMSFGLLNNGPYAQITNGTSVGNVSIITDLFTKSHTGTIYGIAISANHQTIAISATNGIYCSTFYGGSWGSFTTVVSGTYSNPDIAITADGSRIVWTTSNTGSYCYYAIWNANSQNYTGTTQTLDNTLRNYISIAMTADGTRVATAVLAGYIYTAGWTGTNYAVFTQISDSNVRQYRGIALNADGSRLYVGSNDGTDNLLFYSVWNTTTGNYGPTVQIANLLTGNSNWIRRVKCSLDGNIVFVSSYGASTGIPQISCYTYNGTSYIAQTPYVYGSSVDQTAMATITDGSYNYIYIGITTSISRFRYTASNQYITTNIYSTQNLNDNVWRHYAWTIDPSNTTYKYYINGSPIKTDISSAYIFPASTTRTTNLLGVSTDLSMSYFTGGIDQYRVYSGVLTDTQIYSLFQTDAYSSRTLLYYYSFDPSFNTGTNIANLATNSQTGVYDASLNGGAYISASNYKIGAGALAMDTSGQSVTINSKLITSNTGLSISFWMRGNNGCGQYTLLDYSNGFGGNNRISLGLQNNTLLSNVVNGTGMGTVNIGSSTLMSSNTTMIGLAYTGPTINRLIYTDYTNSLVKFRIGLTGADTTVGTTYTNPIDVRVTSDGSRIVWSCRSGYCYYATWIGSTYSSIQTINSGSGTQGFQGMDMTDDGNKIIMAIGSYTTGTNGVPLWAFWTGSGYSSYLNTLNATVSNYISCAITSDGSRIAYANYATNTIYYATWNGTNYTDGISAGTFTGCRTVRFSKDGNILFVMGYNASYSLQYYIWNGTTYTLMVTDGTVFGVNFDVYGFVVDYDGSLYATKNNSGLYKASYTVSNQYVKTNFYSAQNLNDNTWRHIAWTIDPSNTTYKYYVSGSLVLTDASSNNIFPSPNTKTYNLLGTATDLSMSYFIGGIDNYRVYSSVLTDAQVAVLASETNTEGTITTLYPLDTTTVSGGTSIANYASGSYVYDASLNGGATISTTNYKVGVGSLSLDTSGQTLKINKSLNNTTGLSFVFWQRSSSGTGQTTLLDYAAGSGGNQKITYGLQNNQIYAQVTNGTTVGTPTFSQAQTATLYSNAVAIAYAPTTNIAVYATTTGVIYIRTGGITTSGQDAVAVSGSYPGINNLFLTTDGSRLVWSIRGGDAYYARWNGTAFSGSQTINTGTATIQGMDMTDDGSILVVACGNVFGGTSGGLKWCYWTGINTGYSSYTAVLNTGVGDFVSCAITPDGNRITYLDYTTNQLYYAIWNGTNYSPERYALFFNGNGTTMNNYSYYNTFSTGTIECWIKTTGYFGSDIQMGLIVKNNNFSLYVWTGGILACYDWNGGQIGYGTTPVNDGKWHHVALVYQNGVSNGSQLYVDGKPDGSSFTRNNTGVTTAGITIGTEYRTFKPFWGYMDEMRFWNVALSSTAILQNYNTRLSKTTANLTGYWSFDEGTGTTANEAVSGSQSLTLNSQMTWVPRDIMAIPSGCRNLKMSKDGNILFLLYPGTTNVLRYLVWDGTSYGSAITPTALNTTTVFDNAVQCWGLWVDYNNAVYTIDYNNTIVSSTATTTLYKTVFKPANQYTATHFYAQENLNNRVWRQLAWTIDPYTFTYKYYVNGALVKTDTSANYVFPAIASRTSNQLGVSTDLSLSFFKGKFDYYRVYNGVLTDAQIATLYQNEVYTFQPLSQYYSLDVNTTELVQNGYFSLPNLNGANTTAYAPTGWNYLLVSTPSTGYTFTAGTPAYGISVNTPVPTGASQYILLRDNGSYISQDIAFPFAGYYSLTFYASARVGDSYQNIQARVNIGTVVVDNFVPLISNNWVKYSITFYVNSASTHTLQFRNYYPTYNGSSIMLVGVSILPVMNNLRIANSSTGINAYDASLNTGTTVSSNQYKTGVGSLCLDVKGQYTQLGPLTTTTNTGVSFSCWVKANNQCGQSTLLDYSNGQGGNQRISLAFQNNNLLAQVVNGSTLSAPTFTSYSYVDNLAGTIKSIAVYSPTNRIVYADYVAYKIYVKNGTSATYTPLSYTASGLINYIDITSDGSRIVWCVATDYCYYATWNGTTYTNITTINQNYGTMNIYCVDITDDGNTLAVFSADSANGMLWAKWTGNGYSPYTKTTPVIKSTGIISPDGSKVAYLVNSNQLYFDTWDGSTYTNPTYIGTLYTSGSTTYTLAFSKDGNIIFSTSNTISTSILQYTLWSGTGYGTITTTSVFSAPIGFADLKVDYNNTIYALQFQYGVIYKTTYQISNQYIATNFYTTQNLNDNTWRHIAWTIDPTNTTYRYYLNGSLIYTDTSSGYVFPAQTTRITNLLGTATDLPQSFFTGAIDNYRVYNGVLTPAQIYAMYNYENTGTNTLLSYYPLDALSYSETYVGNYTTGVYVYDATLVGGATINSKSAPPVGNAALNLDTSGQYLALNSSFTTTASGLSISFWMRGNNGCGQYTLLDYSNGAGGNNRVSLGLQNNILYSNVVNGTGIGSLTFTSSTLMSNTSMIGLAYTGSTVNRLIYTDYGNSLIKFRTGLTGSDTSVGTYTNPIDVRVTSDGSRIVWCCRTGYSYYATWNGTTYSNVQTINSGSGTQGFEGMDMTDDGNIVIMAIGVVGVGTSGVPIWAYWTGSGYSSFKNTLNATVSNYICCAITPDGNRIAYVNFTTGVVYYATWNGTNYTDGINIGTFWGCRMVRFSKDGNILFVTAYNATYSLQYYVWNGSTYTLMGTNTIFGVNFDVYGFVVDYDGSLYATKNGTGLYKASFSVSNQYTATNFYSTQNLNDNAWRHYAWTIDPSNTTYKYYLNGSLIKTDVSSAYIFPASTTRTNNLLGVSTDLSLSYFTGNICQYRVQSGILTDAQIYSLYTSDAYGGNSLVQYYDFESAARSGNNLGNYASGNYYITDASLNVPTTGNLVQNGYFTSPSAGTTSVTLTTSNIVNWQLVNLSQLKSVIAVAGDPSTAYGATTPLPTGVSQFMVFKLDSTNSWTNSGIYQTIIFPAFGKYTLSFWMSRRTPDGSYPYSGQTITFTIGTNTATYSATTTNWVYNTMPITITDNKIQDLSISTTSTTLSGDQSTYVSAVSIVSAFDDISTSNSVVGYGALSLDVSGQYVRMNNGLPTTAGLSFSFWARGNNGCGLNTLLDYSNGQGANNKMTFGLYNNGPYAQITNTTSVGSVSIITDPFTKVCPYAPTGIAFSANHQIMVIGSGNGIFFSTFSGGIWSSFTTVISATYSYDSSIAITADGSRIIWVGNNAGTGYCYFATWSATAQNYTGITQMLDYTARNYYGIAMTSDGNRIVMAVNSGYIYTSYWNGTNYAAFTQISDSNVRSYLGVALSADGNRLYACSPSGTDNFIYYSMWNTTTGNYGSTVQIANVMSGQSGWMRRIKCSLDGNIVFISSYGASAGIPQIACYVYNGTSYVVQTPYVYGSSVDQWGMATITDGSYNYIYIGNGTTTMTRFRYTVSNQYTSTNIYSTQNLNDNAWRHYAWTIDPTNFTYKYYVNGSLIKTDISSAYIFPGFTARINTLLGTATDLSMSYFTGGIDNYRVYNGVLTDTQVYSLFNADAYNSQSLIQYYPCQQYYINTLLPTLTTPATLVNYYTFETTNMVSNGTFDSTILSVSTAYNFSSSSAQLLFWSILGGSVNVGLVNFLYKDASGNYQYPRGVVLTTINQFCDIPTNTSQQNYISQNIVFPTAGNYKLTFYGYCSNSNCYPTVLTVGTNTIITVSASNNTAVTWTLYSASFYVSSASSQVFKIAVPISASSGEFWITGISIVPNTEYSINTVKDTLLANMASGTPVYDTTLVGRPIDTTGNSKVGYNSLYLYGTGTTQIQYAQINSYTVTTGGITISCWFKYSSGSGSRVFQFGASSANNSFGYSPSSGIFVYYGASLYAPSGGSGKSDGNWHHFVWTMTYAPLSSNTSIHNIFIDGVNIFSTTTGYYPLVETKTTCYIGKSFYSGELAAVGWVDDFRVYNGVLNATDALTLYNNTSISYTYGLSNYTTGSNVYDASFNGGATITTTDYKTGNAALTMDTSATTISYTPSVGAFVRLNNNFTTSSAGLSFSMWFKARNGVGQSTLLDYSNGSGGNQRISLGLQNNQLVGQVVNGTGINSALTFTTAQSASIPTTTFTGIAYSTSANRFVITDYGTGAIYFRTGFSGSNTAISGTYTNVVAVCLTSDGSRLVWSVRGGNCYYATWDGTTYSNVQTINSGAIAGIQGMDMTDDGKIIVVAVGVVSSIGSAGIPVWAYWTGTGYSTYKTVLNVPTDNYVSCAITPDGSRIAYANVTTNKIYYAVWNGTNYTNSSYSNNMVQFNNNSINKYYLSLNGTNQYAATTNTAYYAYTSGTIEAWINTSANVASFQGIMVKQCAYGLFLYANQLTAYDWTAGAYTYSSKALNDGVWHHVALVFQAGVSNGSKIYVDGLPVVTYTHNGILNQSEKFYLGCGGNGGTIQFFNGYIDEARIWSTVRSDTAIYENYNRRINATSTGLTGYWTLDEGTGTTLNNLVSGGYAMTLYNSPTWTTATEIANIGTAVLCMKFSKDGNILFLTAYVTNKLRYLIWNGTSFGSVQTNTILNVTGYLWGLVVDYNNTIYACPYSGSSIYSTIYGVSNRYTATNFYSTQNLNDNSWRHLAWTIDPVNTRYKYYLNGALIKTDASSGYVFPALTNRTNNLLGTSTDLSMSYFSGTIDNYQVYNGVLTDAQIYSLFNSDAYNSQQLIQYYSFDTTTAYGSTVLSTGVYGYANVANITTGSNVYDASLNGGAYINTTNYCVGNAALSLDVSGQYLRMNNMLTTSGIGLSFVFWMRGNNGCGLNTLLDYSNGTGGNNRISFGLYNNSPYAQITNTTSVGSVSIITDSFTKTLPANTTSGIAFSANHQTLAISTNGGIYCASFSGGVWSNFNTVLSATYTNTDVVITADGTRIVWIGNNSGTGYCYFATWSASAQNFTGTTQTLDGTARNYYSIAMTSDGSRIVTAVSSGYIYTASWNGTNYSVFTQIADSNARAYRGIALSADGNRLYAGSNDGTDNILYYSLWNTTTGNYGATVQMVNVLTGNNNWLRRVKCSMDGNIVFISSYGASAGIPLITCYVYNGTSYIAQTPYTYGSSVDQWGMGIITDSSYNYIYIGNGTTTLTRFRYTVSNQYTATNVYSAQNLNDNAWRHYAWTIDPSNTTYKYYLNGSLIKTDISSAYIFPGLTTRTNNLLGTSTDLSMSYFTGGIDNYRVYNGVLTDAQIQTLYKTEAYSNAITTSNGATLVQYYPCDSNKWTVQPALSANYDLVHHYTFDYHTVNECLVLNTANYTPVYDCCLTGNTTLPTLDTGDYKTGFCSLYFSSASLYLQVNGITVSPVGFSVACWFKNTSGLVFDFENTGLDILSYSPTSGITFKNGTTNYTINGGSGKADGTWHHFAWTISSQGSHNVYIDGTISATTNSVAPVFGTRINNYIGKGVGRVDDFRVYSGVLTATDVQNLYNLTPITSTITMTSFYTMDSTQIQNGFVPNMATGYPVYDAVFSPGIANLPTVDIYNSQMGLGGLNIITSSYAQIKQVNVTNVGMTIALWLKVAIAPSGTNWSRITDFGNGTTGGFNNYGIFFTNSAIGSLVYIGTTYYTVTYSTTTHLNGGWHHLVLTMTYSNTNTSTHVLYLDGTAVTTSSTARYPSVGVRVNNRIGCSVLNTDFLNGHLDDLRIYNGVLTASDVSALYSLTQTDKIVKIPNLTNHYTFEPGLVGGSFVANMSSNTMTYDMVLGPGIIPTIDMGFYKQGVRGLKLDGTYKQYVSLTNFSVPSSVGMTITCWFKYTSANWSRLFDFGNGSSNDNLAYSPSDGIAYVVGTAGQTFGLASGKNDGTWHHFAWSIVYVASGGTTHKIYIDGTPTSYSFRYPTVGTRTYCYLGKSNWTADDYATGYIDDFRIYNGVLTDADVTGIIGSSTYSTSIAPVIQYTFE